MEQRDWLAERFEENRRHLRAVAYRMLGSASEAEDAVQEAWVRLARTDAGTIENLGGWLRTVVGRVCLDMLRSRRSRREESLDARVVEPIAGQGGLDAEEEAMLGDSVGLAMLVVLEALSPVERVAFVLHDMFDLPFDEIATIVDRSPAAARKLASRARARVRAAHRTTDADPTRQREVVDAFLAASRNGDFDALLAVLDPEVVLRADDAALRLSASRKRVGGLELAPEVRGATAVGRTFAGRARAAQPALVDGAAGLVWAPGGQPRSVLSFTVARGRIVAIDLIADTDRIRQFDLTILSG